jgi:hypothetical protein
MDKVIRDGRVAVLYSPGFGAGWYSWNTDKPELLFEPNLVAMIEAARPKHELEAYVETKYGEDAPYCGGLCNIKIAWLPVGTLFQVHEYDGSESIKVKEEMDWLTA